MQYMGTGVYQSVEYMRFVYTSSPQIKGSSKRRCAAGAIGCRNIIRKGIMAYRANGRIYCSPECAAKHVRAMNETRAKRVVENVREMRKQGIDVRTNPY